jgi:hypothetical protein
MENVNDDKIVITNIVRSLLQGEDEPIYDATAWYDWDIFSDEEHDNLYVKTTPTVE